MSTSPMQPPVASAVAANLWVKYRREVIATVVALIVLLVLVVGLYAFFLRMPQTGVENAAAKDVVSLIYSDAETFHKLWIRWTAVDWILTFLATGTALSAVIKNSVSVKSGAADNLSFWDIMLVVLAIFAVLGTTFDGKIHAGMLADKYRAGDLILQEAEIDYASSKKDAAALDALVKRWHEAQTILESTSMTQKPGSSAPTGAGQQAAQGSSASTGQNPAPGVQTSATGTTSGAKNGAAVTSPAH